MAKFGDPIKRVPPEIWEIILEKVQYFGENNDDWIFASSIHLYNCYRACETFRAVLENTKSSWLFAQVVSFIASYLTEEELLHCRLICKLWKSSVDYYIENEEDYASTDDFHRHDFQKLTCCFFRKGKIPRFLETFENHSGNPFPGSTLYLKHTRCVTFSDIEFWQSEVFSLLTKYGQHVHNLSIKCPLDNDNISIQTILSLTPNLRRLTIGSLNYGNFIANSRFKSEPFPDLKFLKYLKLDSNTFEMDNWCYSVEAQSHILRQYQNQLRGLRIHLFEDLEIIKNPFMLPNLESLEVTILYPRQLCAFFPSLHLPFLQSLKITFWKRSLHLPYAFTIDESEEISIRNVVKPMIPISSFLNRLTVIADDDKIVTKSFTERDLECLKSFNVLKYLRLDGFYFKEIRLLLKLPMSLEYLHVWGDVCLVDGLFYDDGLSDNLPKLRELSVQMEESKKKLVFQRESKTCWDQRSGSPCPFSRNDFLRNANAERIWLIPFLMLCIFVCMVLWVVCHWLLSVIP